MRTEVYHQITRQWHREAQYISDIFILMPHAHVFSMVSDGMQEEEKGLLLRGPDPPQSNFSPIFTGETLNPVCESGLTLQAIPTSALCQNWFQIAEQCCACVLALLNVYLLPTCVSPWEMINFSSFRICMVT